MKNKLLSVLIITALHISCAYGMNAPEIEQVKTNPPPEVGALAHPLEGGILSQRCFPEIIIL